MPPSAISKRGQVDRGIKRSAFSCEPCRERKVKCGAEQPRCTRCVQRGDTCQYKLNPTLSYTQRLESQVRRLKTLLVQALGSLPPDVDLGDDNATQYVDEDAMVSSDGFESLTVSNTGQVSFHGPTSFVRLPSISSRKSIDNGNEGPLRLTDRERIKWRERLVSNALQQRVLEGSFDTPEPFQYLLDFHWTWIHPLFNFVYRPAFTRDMEVMGPYYSHTLLSALLSHSKRWCNVDPNIARALEQYENGEIFSRQARSLLHDDLRNGRCDIPTIQALLLISAQDCSKGEWTQAWMHSGIAFRLVEDLGINIDGDRYAGSTQFFAMDIEIRNRLFWSCYVWDKLISLYLGRCPSIQHSNVSPPQVMLDDSTERELWSPHGVAFPDEAPYPPTPAYSVSTFTWACNLAVILSPLLAEVYDPLKHPTAARISEIVGQQKLALRKWWQELPEILRLFPEHLPPQCPPSHIVTLNCLYHVTQILVHRPALLKDWPKTSASSRESLGKCVEAARAIKGIFQIFRQTFGSHRCVMALSYSLYMATSVFLFQVQTSKPFEFNTLEDLKYCTIALREVAAVNEVLNGALNMLQGDLIKLGINLDTTPPTNGSPVKSEAHGSAFGTELYHTTSNGSNASGSDPFADIDALPITFAPPPQGFTTSSALASPFPPIEHSLHGYDEQQHLKLGMFGANLKRHHEQL